MNEHEIVVRDIRHVEQEMEFTGKALTESDITKTNTVKHSSRQFFCSCGEEEMTYDEAVEHMQSQNNRVEPETFEEVARKLKKGESIPESYRENGYVLSGRLPQTDYSGNPLKNGVIVTYQMAEDEYVVGIMHRKTETVGRNDPKQKVRENTYVKVAMYECDKTGGDNVSEVGEYVVENGTHIDDGYINGYRLTRLSSVLDDVFRYHAF